MFFQKCFIQEWRCTNIQVHIYNMPFEMIFIYPFITYQAGRVRAGVPTKAVENLLKSERMIEIPRSQVIKKKKECICETNAKHSVVRFELANL